MDEIPQRELRNHVSRILRAAEAGQTYTITVDGRPVAELGPYRRRRWVERAEVTALLASPTDPALLDDVARQGPDADLSQDPWSR